jgi:hypothetical protein
MNMRARALFSVGIALAAFGTARAHHSVTGSFDTSRNIEITGKVVEWRFRNPHTLLVVDGTAIIDGKRDDVTRRWEIESSAAAGLRASGVDEKTFVPGSSVTVKGIPLRKLGRLRRCQRQEPHRRRPDRIRGSCRGHR